ncbi:Dph6-related ATP pyrophosphatase [Roseivirga echinicomitans]
MHKKAVFNWSGGKDSALALHYVLQEGAFKVMTLLTSIDAQLERVSMHGVHKTLLKRQVEAIGLPLSILPIPSEVTMPEYDLLMTGKMEVFKSQGITHSIFGDIFLEDLKEYRKKRLTEVGLSGHFPLWKRNTTELVKEFIDLGFKTMLVSVDGSKLDKSFVGQVLDHDLIKELPKTVDPCGENGEFHSFAFDGPIFNHPVQFEKGEVVPKDYTLSSQSNEKVTYWFQDLL